MKIINDYLRDKADVNKFIKNLKLDLLDHIKNKREISHQTITLKNYTKVLIEVTNAKLV